MPHKADAVAKIVIIFETKKLSHKNFVVKRREVFNLPTIIAVAFAIIFIFVFLSAILPPSLSKYLYIRVFMVIGDWWEYGR